MAGVDPDRPVSTTAWVIGATGLLGSAVCRRLVAQGRELRTTDVPWDDPTAAVEALLHAADQLPQGWEAYWCAGAGVVGSSQAELDAEIAVLNGFLTSWEPRPAGNGLFLASSAGGVYAGASGPPFTEHTEPAPISAYGRAKLRSEEIGRAHV